MLFTIEGLLGVILFCVTAIYFLNATKVREFAIDAVTFEGKKGNFQLLDQSVHLNKLSLSRDSNGRWKIWRQYRFDYSLEGDDRRQGYVIMLGNTRQTIVFAERLV
ncbi:MAG: DUF3301 domain-containing protein [Halieaceae bacterium]|nr:DUF3301 domain-containing protein [Halieaceae bacterium]